MKIKNIGIAILFALIGFSCSMGDDLPPCDGEKEGTGVEEYAALNFGISLNDPLTKGSTDITGGGTEDATGDGNTGEKKVNDFTIFLLEDSKVIGVVRDADNQVNTDETMGVITLKGSEFLTKWWKGRVLKACVAINARTELADVGLGKSEADLNVALTGALEAEKLVKYGTIDLNFGEAAPNNVTKRNSSPATAKNNPNTVVVTVSQVAARLDFSQFDVTLVDFPADELPVVTFEKAEFVHLQNNGLLTAKDSYANGEATIDVPVTIPEKTADATPADTWSNIMTAYSYAHAYGATSETNTALYVKFKVGGRTFEKTYPINPPATAEGADRVVTNSVGHTGIKGGYLYDIKVHWTIYKKWADSTIEFYTRDWVHNDMDDVEIPWEENNPSDAPATE